MIRPARPDDVRQIVALVRELAEYEREPESAVATPAQLAEALFGDSPAVFCHVAEDEGAVVGFAVWFVTFSTWLGRHGIYIEDLFVRPPARRQGHGRALLSTLAAIATRRGYGRLEWAVLDWNTSAQAFYASLGAAPLSDWTTWRLTETALSEMAARSGDGPST